MTKVNSVELLIGWLKEHAKKEIFPRTHDLHLTDWEVRELLADLDPPRIEPDYKYGGVWKADAEDLDADERPRNCRSRT